MLWSSAAGHCIYRHCFFFYIIDFIFLYPYFSCHYRLVNLNYPLQIHSLEAWLPSLCYDFESHCTFRRCGLNDTRSHKAWPWNIPVPAWFFLVSCRGTSYHSTLPWHTDLEAWLGLPWHGGLRFCGLLRSSKPFFPWVMSVRHFCTVTRKATATRTVFYHFPFCFTCQFPWICAQTMLFMQSALASFFPVWRNFSTKLLCHSSTWIGPKVTLSSTLLTHATQLSVFTGPEQVLGVS